MNINQESHKESIDASYIVVAHCQFMFKLQFDLHCVVSKNDWNKF